MFKGKFNFKQQWNGTTAYVIKRLRYFMSSLPVLKNVKTNKKEKEKDMNS